jgi:mannose-6-phosphate isomerase-like protein (cupin superfamily)
MSEPTVIDVKKVAKENVLFREVLYTAEKTQLVVMSLAPGEEIGEEVHDGDQLLYVAKGEGTAVFSGSRRPFDKGSIFCVPAGTRHNVVNTGDEPLKLFTIYAPAQHAAGTVHRTKADAAAAEAAEARTVVAG